MLEPAGKESKYDQDTVEFVVIPAVKCCSGLLGKNSVWGRWKS